MQITVVNPKKVKTIFCPKCKNKIRAELHQKKTENWIIVRRCQSCRFEKILFQEDVDILQPSSQLWDLVYDDPEKDFQEIKKELEYQKEKRKEKLDLKYDREFKKPWERKFVKDKVLREDNLYGL